MADNKINLSLVSSKEEFIHASPYETEIRDDVLSNGNKYIKIVKPFLHFEYDLHPSHIILSL